MRKLERAALEPQPDAEFLVEIFSDLGIPRLAERLETGDLTALDEHSISQYCSLAAIWASPPIRLDNGCLAREEMVSYFGSMILQILSGEGPDYIEVDGVSFLTPGDRTIEVTPSLLCHYQHCWKLASDEGSAWAFLALAPAAEREAALAHARQLWDVEAELVADRLGFEEE